jgi:hypothetical protein
LLWKFRFPIEYRWLFGKVLPFDGGLYVDTANRMLKLH